MGTFVFVHGAWHGAWCWEKVTPLLGQAGCNAIALDLPGHGQNRAKPPEEITLADYVECIASTLDQQLEPVVLVAHSLGGISASQAAEYRPDKIEALVYLSAIVLENGKPLLSKDRAPLDWLSEPDEQVKDRFYGDCSDEDFRWARERLVPQPPAPYYTAVHVSEGKFGRVPKIYITCLRDHAIPPQMQEEMYNRIPFREIIPMHTSHSPFLSAPAKLAEILLSIAG